MASQHFGSMQQQPNVPPDVDVPEPEEEQMEDYFRTPFRRPSAGSIRNIVGTLAVAALIIGIVWFIEGSGTETSQAITLTASATGPAPHVDEPAPPFELRTLEGEVVSLSDYQGQAIS